MRKKLQIFILLCMCIYKTYAQDIVVTGNVTDAINGMPLMGVNVIVKDTNNGVSTDFDGNFKISTFKGVILRFTYVGYVTKEVTVSSSVVNISLETDSEGLDEVVVTALGVKKEVKKLGYSMTEVKGDIVAQQNQVTPVSALQGRSPGVSVGASDGGLFSNTKIQIRGVSTLNSNNNQPIFVVDGVILENAVSDANQWTQNSNDYGNVLKNINPDDIASISVLKGAAATALYGSRGMNGVILIETKSGEGFTGLGISFSQSMGFDHVYRHINFQNEFGRGTLAGYVDYGDKDSSDKFFKYDTSQFTYNSEGKRSLLDMTTSLSYGPKYDGKPIIGWDGEEMPYSASPNNVLDLYDLGVNSNTHIALKGGNKKGSVYISDSYNVRTATLPNSIFKRNALAFRADYQLADWLKIKGSVTISNSLAKNAKNDVAQSLFETSQKFFRSFDIKKYKDRKYWQAKHGGIPQESQGDKYHNIPGKSLWWRFHEENEEQKEDVVRPVVGLSIRLYDSLHLNLEANGNYYNIAFEQKNLGSGYLNEGGAYKLKHTKDVSEMAKANLNWEYKFMDMINFRAIVGGEMWRQEKSYSSVWTEGGLTVPGKFFIGNSVNRRGSEAKVYSTKKINSLYFMGDIEYNNELFLNITGRNDWSSALVNSDGSGNYSYFYPSASLSWVFTERFHFPGVNFGKLRISWAQVGNDTAPYQLNRGYSSKKYELPGGGFAYVNEISNTLVNKDLNPERKNSFEIGTDISMLNDRLSLDFSYYDETISNQIGNIPLPSESGYSSFFTNIGTMRNSGIEVSISVTPIRTNNFQYNTTFNYWRNRTVVTKLHKDYGAYKTLSGGASYGNWRIAATAKEGEEYGILMSDSAPKKYNNPDNPNDPKNGMKELTWNDDRRGAYYRRSGEVEKVGKIQPDFEGSWLNEFNFKGVYLSVLLDMRFGGHIGSYSSRYGASYGFLESSLQGRNKEYGGIEWTSKYSDTRDRKYDDGVIPDGVFAKGQTVTTPDGRTQDVGGMTYKETYEKGYVEPTHASYYNYFKNSWSSGVINDDWFREAHYVAIRNISLGYRLPQTVAKVVGARGLSIGINVQNVGFLYSNMPNGINPESFRGTSSAGTYKEVTLTPYTRSYTMNLSFDF